VADCKLKADLLRQFVRAIKSVKKLKIANLRGQDKKGLKKLKAQLKIMSQDVSSALKDLGIRRKTVALLRQKKVGKLLKNTRAELKTLRKEQSKNNQAQLLESLTATKKIISKIPDRNF
jgi:hypothetical protein